MSINKYNASTGELTNLASGSRIWTGTKAQYDAQKAAGTLPNNCLIIITDDEQDSRAEQISYDNTNSELTADNVQDAIDELTAIKGTITAETNSYYTVQQPGIASQCHRIGNLCIISITFAVKTTSSEWVKVGTTNIKPKTQSFIGIYTGDFVEVRIDTSGNILAAGGTAGKNYHITGAYLASIE